MTRTAAALCLAATVWATGCAPRLAPLTRDYALAAADSLVPDSVRTARAMDRAAEALRDAGWTPAPAGGLALTTDTRAGADWGLYDIRVSLDVLPLADGTVRLVFDPVRRYVWRTRTHIPYLPSGVLRTFVPPLDAALRAEGLVPQPSGAARDLGRRANRVDG